MESLNIGILTFHKCINYGSYWQAKCLIKGLQARGHEVTILDHHSTSINIAELKCAYRPLLPTQLNRADYPLYREKIQGFFRAFQSLPLSSPFNINKPEEMKAYDVIVIGSDEVWNLTHPWYGKIPIFFGEGLFAKRIISYAASFGNYSAWNGLEPYWIEQLKNLDQISVRDENAQAIFRHALNFNPEIVLDPCLVFPLEIDGGKTAVLQDNFIAIYGHHFSNSFIAKLRKWAKQKNMTLISIGYRNDWADKQWITANPNDFALFMAKAKAVATNFFHGCIFALRNNKPFICEPTSYRSIKLLCLMELLDGENHIVYNHTPSTVFNGLLSNLPEEKMIHKIEFLKAVSNAFLDEALKV
ncbi:Polysaccharide pyruvyl transferase [Legionella wadsworthii]|uniref:Polysaccharide pyruvyl transferase n=1 Tax=Legionella wadsworthii TaxID=28088 RepID=A0A378LXN8_9GAMM|nr:polysaccharide pyruvyl transferase family protein [Legionella wadsworthii]STY31147.1 Polysaccharide pyruvyl transferase [Legionella wadsworthii]